jgi:hypothetical protein
LVGDVLKCDESHLHSRAFFQRFPGLFDVLKTELEEAEKVINSAQSSGAMSPLEAALYPTLILLAKLQPSPVSSGSDEYEVGKS